MKLITWNVNGLRACLSKGFLNSFAEMNGDIICLQETKMEQGQAEINPIGYHQIWNSAEKKGYSGTAVFSRIQPQSHVLGMGLNEHDREGRIIVAEYMPFYLVNVYTPNAQRELARLEYRMQWDDDFRAWLQKLDQNKPVIVCGDLNVAHNEIDLKNPRSNVKNAGFTPQERAKFSALLEAGFVDVFRMRYPEKTGAYTWWSYMRNARATNAGWRIDYFLVSRRIADRVQDIVIHADILGSDHCPVELQINFN